jgi:hypothetical protein
MLFFLYIILQTKQNKTKTAAGHWWLMPVIPATQKTEIRRTAVQSQPRKILCENLSQKNPPQKWLVEWLK